jgi:hypothetical protein
VLALELDRWQGLGMAARSDERLRAAGLAVPVAEGLSRDAGQQAFLNVLQSGGELEQVLISARALASLPEADLFTATSRAALAAHAAAAMTGGPALVANARELSPTELRDQLGELWQQVLGRAPASTEQSFFEQGGDSLLALAILNRVRQAFAVDIGLREFFVRPTLGGLTEAVQGQLGAPGAGHDAGPALVALPRTPGRRGGTR